MVWNKKPRLNTNFFNMSYAHHQCPRSGLESYWWHFSRHVFGIQLPKTMLSHHKPPRILCVQSSTSQTSNPLCVKIFTSSTMCMMPDGVSAIIVRKTLNGLDELFDNTLHHQIRAMIKHSSSFTPSSSQPGSIVQWWRKSNGPPVCVRHSHLSLRKVSWDMQTRGTHWWQWIKITILWQNKI